MQLFNVYENGALRKVNEIDFDEHKVFLIDDVKTIYLWFGQKSSQKKRDLSKKKAQKIITSRTKKISLEILHQGKEYGRFLTIHEALKKGTHGKVSLERRNELKIKINDTLELIEAGIEPDFEAKITITAHKLSEEKKSYEELCHILARLQLELLNTQNRIKETEIKKKATEIHQSSATYDELCWLIAEMRLIREQKRQI